MKDLKKRAIQYIYSYTCKQRQKLIFEGDKVYLGAGVLPTAKIILESLETFDRELEMKDSQYFILPILRYSKVKNIFDEELHTLAQQKRAQGESRPVLSGKASNSFTITA